MRYIRCPHCEVPKQKSTKRCSCYREVERFLCRPLHETQVLRLEVSVGTSIISISASFKASIMTELLELTTFNDCTKKIHRQVTSLPLSGP